MAEGKPHKDLRHSVQAGSGEIFDIFCQPCNPDKHLEADGYCQDCCEYLCLTCIEYHGKLSATQMHTVLSKSAMPEMIAQPKIGNNDVLTTKCRKHPDKVYEYFCKFHNQTCCSICVALDHSSCSDRRYIPDISSGIGNSQEYCNLKADLNRLLEDILVRQEQSNGASKLNETYHSKALVNIRKLRTQINELLDKIENDTKEMVAKFHQENTDVIRNVSERCQSLLSEATSMAKDIDELAKEAKNNKLFVQIKLSCDRVTEVEKQMKEIVECKIKHYSLNYDGKAQQMMSTLSELLSLTVRHDGTPTSAQYLQKVSVKSDDDTLDCLINGMALLHNDRMVLVDYNNRTIKLFDVKVNKCISILSLSSEPFDVTELKPQQCAVALANEKKIGVIHVLDVLSKGRVIATPGVVITGLCNDGSNFIAACQNPGCVKIIDMSGKTLRTFSTDSNKKRLFTRPRYITLSRDKTVVYITDKEANAVTTMTVSGHIMSVYRHEHLKFPLGVAVGRDGTVYVCSRDNHVVHLLTPSGDLIQMIQRKDQRLPYFPDLIAYNDEKDILFIGSNSVAPSEKDYIRMYQLE